MKNGSEGSGGGQGGESCGEFCGFVGFTRLWTGIGGCVGPGGECIGKFERGLESVSGEFLEAFEADLCEFGGEIGLEGPRVDDLLTEELCQRGMGVSCGGVMWLRGFVRIGGGLWRVSGKECVEEAAESIDIGGWCELVWGEQELFGCGPWWGPAAWQAVAGELKFGAGAGVGNRGG
jgi:hypothetical protein